MLRSGLVALTALLALGATACSSGSARTASAPPRPEPSGRPTPALVERVALSGDDLGPGFRVRSVSADGGVLGDHTLATRLGVGASPLAAGCGTPLVAQRHRVGHWLGEVYDAQDRDYGVTEEVVEYDAEAHARATLTELRRAARQCPRHRFTRSSGQLVPGIRYDESWFYREKALPVADNAVMYPA